MSDISKNKIDNRIMTYTVGALVFALIAVALKTVLMLSSFDEAIGYYDKSFAVSLLNGLYIAVGIFLFSSLKVIDPAVDFEDSKKTNVCTMIFSSLAMLAFFFGFLLVDDLFGGTLAIIIKWSSFASALFFALNSFLYGKRREMQAFLGFGIIVWGVCIVLSTYFDASTPLNGPEKIDLHLALASILFFILNELRTLVGQMKKGLYISSVTLAIFFGFAYSLPSIIYSVSRVGSGNGVFSWDIVILAFSAYCACRLVSIVFFASRPNKSDVIENNDTEQNI